MKLKKFFKILVISLLAASAVFACACSGAEKENKIEVPARETYEGTHIFNVSETPNDFISGGRTEYKLVVPADCSSHIQQAKNEFVHLFKQATGITLLAVEDTNLQHDPNAKYISLGKTALLESSGVSVDYTALGRDGGRIVTKDKTIYIVGGQDKGTLYTVYTFMNLCFNFEQYYIDCYEIDSDVTDMKLKKFDVTDIPDIPIRANDTGLYNLNYTDYDESNFAVRMKMGTKLWDRIFPIHSEYNDKNSTKQQVHNSLMYLPLETYQATHSDWFSDRGEQLCYTAHGNQTEWEAMAQECAKKLANSLVLYSPEEYPEYNVATLTIEDNFELCNCSACTQMKEQYGTESAAAIIFVNRVAEIIDEWMVKPENAAYKRDDFHLIFFAYNNFVVAPSVYNKKTKTYEPIDDKVKFRDNVGLYLAPINNIAYEADLFDELNDAGRNNIEAWNAISNFTYYWLYATNFQHYNYLFDSFNFYSGEAYAYIANRSAQYLFAQQQHDQSGTSTAWHNLKFYLNSKLAWNCSLDEGELVDKWFNAMYKEAAPIMKDLYYKERSWARHVYLEYGMIKINTLYNKVEERKFWPYLVLQSWTNQCDEAMASVEKYKTSDPELYEKLYEHIYAEWIFPAYTTLKIWDNNSMTQAERSAMILKFKEVLDKVDVYGQMQFTDYSGYYKKFIESL